MDIEKLIFAAFDAQRFSYSPYSNFKVGAALLTSDKKIYKGCNIESAAYSATNCAERTAIFKAVSEGETEFLAIAIVGGLGAEPADYCSPCGVCRQVMAEFCPLTFKIIMAKSPTDYIIHTLGELLPLSFGGKLLQ